jgi:hypothetical protein
MPFFLSSKLAAASLVTSSYDDVNVIDQDVGLIDVVIEPRPPAASDEGSWCLSEIGVRTSPNLML